MSCFISEPTTLRAFKGAGRAGNIVDAKLFAMAIAEIKLREVTVQVGLADVLINAVHAAFQDRKEALDGVGADDPITFVPDIFVFGVVDGAMRGEIPTDGNQRLLFVSHEIALERSVLVEDRMKIIAAHVRHMERPRGTVPLDQREYRVHVAGPTADLGSGLPTDKSQIGLQGFSFAAHRGSAARRCHDLADAVHQEPSSFHAAIEGPLNLSGADALFARGDELDRL